MKFSSMYCAVQPDTDTLVKVFRFMVRQLTIEWISYVLGGSIYFNEDSFVQEMILDVDRSKVIST